jgi:hypothetical protein
MGHEAFMHGESGDQVHGVLYVVGHGWWRRGLHDGQVLFAKDEEGEMVLKY